MPRLASSGPGDEMPAPMGCGNPASDADFVALANGANGTHELLAAVRGSGLSKHGERRSWRVYADCGAG